MRRIGYLLCAFAACNSSKAPPNANQPGQTPSLSSRGVHKVAPEPSLDAGSSVDAAQIAPALDCSKARKQAVTHLRNEGKELELSYLGTPYSTEPFDFNNDGIVDCSVSYRGSQQLLFVATSSSRIAYRYVGTVTSDGDVAYGFGCTGEYKHGLCTISAAQHMIHGENQIRTYEFDGKIYVNVGVRLTEPRRKYKSP